MGNLAVGSLLKSSGVFGSFLPLIIISIYVLLILYAFSRSGSLYFFVDKIWRLTGGEKEFKNKSVNEIWSNIKDVEAFRFRTKINVSTLKQINSIEIFLQKHDMGFHDIIPCAKYFDVVNVKLKDYNYTIRLIIIGVLIIFSYFLMIVPQGVASFTDFDYRKSAYLTLNKSRVVVYLQKKQAIIDGKVLGFEKCEKENTSNISEYYSIEDVEAAALCRELLSSESDFYKNTIKEQIIFVGLWIVLCFLSMMLLSKKLYSVSKAVDFKKKIRAIDKEKIRVKLMLKSNS